MRQRVSPRHPINVPLDLIALRSGVPENLPGRCTDLSEAGVGAVVAGELSAGQQVAIELRLPCVGEPVRARAVVRYQHRLLCGFEFVGLSMDQREMIRYWVHRSTAQRVVVEISKKLDIEKPDIEKQDFEKEDFEKQDFEQEENSVIVDKEPPVVGADRLARLARTIRAGQLGTYLLIIGMLAAAALGWWRWHRFWNELEAHALISDSGLRVSPETMEKRVLTKVQPVYPEAARTAKTEGVVVLDATIAPDGSVKHLKPLSGPDLLVRAATDAVQSWKYEPYLSSGKPVEVQTTIAVEFRLN